MSGKKATDFVPYFLSPSTVAAVLCVERHVIYYWVTKGSIESLSLPGRTIRIPARVVSKILKMEPEDFNEFVKPFL